MTQHAEPETDRREKARKRAAAVFQRIRLATDALAAADLLLGMNDSVRSVGVHAAAEPAPESGS